MMTVSLSVSQSKKSAQDSESSRCGDQQTQRGDAASLGDMRGDGSPDTGLSNATGASTGIIDNNGGGVVVAESLLEPRSVSPASQELAEARHKMYEDLYQQYYPYYHAYYRDAGCGIDTGPDSVVELARGTAASSAAAWIQANMPDCVVTTGTSTGTVTRNNGASKAETRDSVIVKMAEYVARNGLQFEQMMLSRNSDRFAFLLPAHADHYQYKKRLDKEIDKLAAAARRRRSPTRSPERDELPDQIIDSIMDSYGLSPPHSSSCPISFKMTASKQRTSAVILPNNTAAGVGDRLQASLDDLDDDFGDYYTY